MHHSHSQTEESRTDIINRIETQQGTIATHFLESRINIVSRIETQQGTTATHFLESQGQASLAR